MAKANRKKSKKKNKPKKPPRKPIQKIADSKSTTSQKRNPKKARTVLSVSWKTIVGASVLCGIAAFAFLLIPRVSLEFGPSLNPKDPFKNIVYLSNNGYLPITDITQIIRLKRARLRNDRGVFDDNLISNRLSDKLSANRMAPVILHNILVLPDNSISELSFDICLEFKLWPIPIPVDEIFAIEAVRTSDNKWVLIFPPSTDKKIPSFN